MFNINDLNLNHFIDFIPYIFLIFLLIVIVIMGIIRIKFKFWALQPVFHVYDIGYAFFPPGILSQNLPIENKYCNFKNIETITYNKLSSLKKKKMINFIRTHYLRNNENCFLPKKENVMPYFLHHKNTNTPLISFYNEKMNILDQKHNDIIEDTKIIGIMTTRPINVTINNAKDKDADFVAYYVDYLCVDKMYRKKGIAPEIIQTHHYNQRRINKDVYVSIFKREGQLTGIVPLCVYSTYGFSLYKWTKPKNIEGAYSLIEISPQNFHLLLDFIKNNMSKFDIVLNSHVSNLIELLKTNNIFISAIICENQIKCAYFYRKTCVFIEKNMEVLCCFASINDCDNNDIFIQGFKCSFWSIADKRYFGFATIENISHNNIIIKYLLIRNHPKIISPTAYFFYNFAYYTFKPEKVLFIN